MILRYLLNSLRYPTLSDFASSGLGIEARFERCKPYWAKHLELTKAFQAASLGEARRAGSLAVLGAGRLLDLDLEALSRKFAQIHLFDADPGSLPFWKKAAGDLGSNCKLEFHLADLSGVLQSWTALLREALKRGSEMAVIELLNSLSEPDVPAPPLRFDCLISLNLLSQIALFWRDRVHDLVKRNLKIDTDENGLYRSELQPALERSMILLENQHLKLLSSWEAEEVILICDIERYYYQSDKAPWLCERAISADLPAMLGNLELCNHPWSWLWHIAPQGVEQSSYGIIHRVEGRHYR
ncbi:MAG: hypothetical protein DCC75_13050 [Proteobacteria bacterium]|nr:MAG: hypothetical protein DCC75_13050 [Pseudomonadota bacterium]